jgi:hypothetical protein
MSISSSSSSSSASIVPAAGLKARKDAKKECKVVVKKVTIEDLTPEEKEIRKIKIKIKEVKIENK